MCIRDRVTVYYGEDVAQSTAEELPPALQEAIGGQYEVEVHSGGQPLYYYIVSVE